MHYSWHRTAGARRWEKQGIIRFPFISFFSSPYTLLLTSKKNPGILMFKKNNTIIGRYWIQLQPMQVVTDKDLMESVFALSEPKWSLYESNGTATHWQFKSDSSFAGNTPCNLHPPPRRQTRTRLCFIHKGLHFGRPFIFTHNLIKSVVYKCAEEFTSNFFTWNNKMEISLIIKGTIHSEIKKSIEKAIFQWQFIMTH